MSSLISNPIACLLLLCSMMLAACDTSNVLGLFYHLPDDDAWQSVLSNRSNISVVAPQVFSVDTAGRVTGSIEERLLRLATDRGLRLMPLLVNENFDPEIAHRVLTDSALRRQVIEQAAALCQKNDCWGLQLDMERVPTEDREPYTQFVREAAGVFHRLQLQFSVAVPSQLGREPQLPGFTQPSFGGYAVVPVPYDLPEIAREVDFLTLMTYDQYGPESPPGPVAGYPWVKQSLLYALQFVPPRKLLLGLAFYARHWCNDSVAESSYREAKQLARAKDAAFRWHPVQREYWFEFEGNGCREIVWLEDRRSLHEKLKLVRQFRLLGFSAWRLGQEDPAFWK